MWNNYSTKQWKSILRSRTTKGSNQTWFDPTLLNLTWTQLAHHLQYPMAERGRSDTRQYWYCAYIIAQMFSYRKHVCWVVVKWLLEFLESKRPGIKQNHIRLFLCNSPFKYRMYSDIVCFDNIALLTNYHEWRLGIAQNHVSINCFRCLTCLYSNMYTI